MTEAGRGNAAYTSHTGVDIPQSKRAECLLEKETLFIISLEIAEAFTHTSCVNRVGSVHQLLRTILRNEGWVIDSMIQLDEV